jgi:hypothetical protein
MAPRIGSFGETARGLSHNPLGIIALFIVLVYGIAALVVGFGNNLNGTSTTMLVVFMVLFPVLVLAVFTWLVAKYPVNLYGPKEFIPGEYVQAILDQSVPYEVRNLRVIQPDPPQPSPSISPRRVPATEPAEQHSGESTSLPEPIEEPIDHRQLPRGNSFSSEFDLTTPVGRSEERDSLYKKFRGVFVVHSLTPSTIEGQEYDVFIYLKRHHGESVSIVKKAEFFFGHHWGNQIFEGDREGDVIGVRTSAYGPFLCTCLVTFQDGHQASLYRYIDFEMGKVVNEIVRPYKRQ